MGMFHHSIVIAAFLLSYATLIRPENFDVTTIYKFQGTGDTVQNNIAEIEKCKAEKHLGTGQCSWSRNGWVVVDNFQTLVSTPGDEMKVLESSYLKKMKPLHPSWRDEGIIISFNLLDMMNEINLHLSTGEDITVSDMILIQTKWQYGTSNKMKFYRCMNYDSNKYSALEQPRKCNYLSELIFDLTGFVPPENIHIFIRQNSYDKIKVVLKSSVGNSNSIIISDLDNYLLSNIKYIGINYTNTQTKSIVQMLKPVNVFALTKSQGTFISNDVTYLGKAVCVAVEYYLQPKSNIGLDVKMILINGTELSLGNAKTQLQGNPWKVHMFFRDIDSSVQNVKIKINVEKHTNSDVFIKEIRKCNNEDDSLLTINRKSSIEIHGKNNAIGLPFRSQDGKTLNPNVAVDIDPCTSIVGGCNWEAKNITHIVTNTPLLLGGYKEFKVEDNKPTAPLPLLELVNFKFITSDQSGEMRIYLLEDSGSLSTVDLYYLNIRNEASGHSNFWKCNSYTGNSNIEIAPGHTRYCNHIDYDNSGFHYWNTMNQYDVTVRVTIEQVVVNIKTKTSEHKLIFSSNNYLPSLKYYAVALSDMKGKIIIKFDDQISLKTDMAGSLTSPSFLPTYSKICVSVFYHTLFDSAFNLRAVQFTGEKLDLIQTQEFHFDNGWRKGIYRAELPHSTLNRPISIEIVGEELMLQRIAGCNSEGLNEDIYAVTNSNALYMDFQNYDVAVKQMNIFSVFGNQKMDCINGGIFDDETESCICPAGFQGSSCETGCGQDRYGSKCDGYCSRTKMGCQEMKLCRPKLGCSCAPGFKGFLCDTPCSPGEYGAGCKQKCGHCSRGNCNIYTGQCSGDCQHGFRLPNCQQKYTHLQQAPEVNALDLHVLEVRFDTGFLSGKGTPEFYQLQIKKEENTFSEWKEMEPVAFLYGGTAEANITDLEPGTKYEVRVVILDKDGSTYDGKDVPIAHIITKCIVPSEVDFKLRTRTVGKNYFQVEWQYEYDNSTICKLKYFELEIKTDWEWQVSYRGKETAFTFSNALPGEKYEVRVRAVTLSSSTSFSETLNVVTKDEAPGVVSDLRIVTTSHNQLLLEWNKPVITSGNIVSYKVLYKCKKLLACKKADCSHSTGEIEVSIPTISLHGLLPYAQYVISVAAKSASYGPETLILGVTEMTVPDITPSSSDTPVKERTNTTLTVQWNSPDECSSINGYLYGYQYELFGSSNLVTPIYEGITKHTTASFSSLSPHSEYTVKVYLRTSAARKPSNSLIIKASTRATVPSRVEKLTVYKVGRRKIGLRWSLPKEMYGELESFTISYKPEGQVSPQTITVKPARCAAWPELYCHTIASLRPDTEYSIRIQARNSEISEDGEIEEITAVTKESAPLSPSYLRTVSQSETNFTIEWGLPSMLNGELRSFLVTVEETDSFNISDCCQYFPIQEIAVRQEQASYQLRITSLKPASTYTVSVTAKTTTLGPAAGLTVHTRPPSMSGKIELLGDSGQISSSPVVGIQTVSNKELVSGYLLLVIPKSGSIDVKETLISDEWLATQLKQRINGAFYVAAELTKKEGEAEITLGTGIEVKNGRWSELRDPFLETDEKYRIGLVSILEYCNVLNIGYTETGIFTVES